MTLKHKAPAWPRPANSSSKAELVWRSPSKHSSVPHALAHVSDVPMLAATPSDHRRPIADRHGQTASYDFPPSVSFDDLHSSIQSPSTEDFKLTRFPSPTVDASVFDMSASTERRLHSQKPAAPQVRVANPPPAMPGRSGSILRRPSASGRQPSTSSIVSSSSATFEVPAGSAIARSRRQSHYPPISNPHVAPKLPRKSVGPEIVGDAGAENKSFRGRRPSLIGEQGGARDSTRRSIDGSSRPTTDGAAVTATSRAAKARSVQPPPRLSQAGQAHAFVLSGLTPDQTPSSTAATRSPRGAAKGVTQTSGGKRASMMPSGHHPSHATGLGARTISPTDTRRMKRLSTMPQSQSLNAVSKAYPPPPSISLDARAQSRSPSMIPRRTTITPSSARTTPEASNRKSYSSGVSAGSTTTSLSTLRTSSASLQPRLSQSSSMSRLPAPKHTTVHNPLPAEHREEVPPVPAIPKAYESPKDSPAEAYFTEKAKLVSSTEALVGHGVSTGSIYMPAHHEPTKADLQSSGNWKHHVVETPGAGEETNDSKHKRHIPPARLPPLSVAPLSISTAVKVSSLEAAIDSGRDTISPPLKRLPKAPSTPLAACKSSFFYKTKYDDSMDFDFLTRGSPFHQTRQVTPTPPEADSSNSSMTNSEPSYKSSISPFISSSLPKGGLDHTLCQRSKTGGDFVTLNEGELDVGLQRKPAGPREPSLDMPAAKPSPPSDPMTDVSRTPSSMNSLRRKLSLSWKRSSPKSGTAASSDAVERIAPRQQDKQESMLPPRIPASATNIGLSSAKRRGASPTTALNGNYLESRRRKSSAASIAANFSHDRVQSDAWTGSKKAAGDSNTLPVSHSFGGVHKTLKPRGSSSALNCGGYSASELDKDDLAAEDEMRKMGSRRKETDVAARALDALRKRATPKERVSPREAIRIATLNIYERGEIIDFGDVYFCGTQNAHKVVGDVQSDAPNFGYDDERGDYTIVPGDHLAYRYEIIDVLGKGSFGQVVRCIDHKLGVLVAIKIIRNKKRFHQQALVEVNILQKLREWDVKNKHSMVSFTQHFYFRGHLCISTELLDMNLYEFIKAHAFRGFSPRLIRRFTKQILSSLILLKQRKVIHCDLKPENILLRHPLQSEIKVIDFGSSCFENEKVYTYIQSRFYRSPEVILGMAYGMPIDMWSVGCILAELYTGVPIFPGENEQEQLACIMEVFGPPEKHLIEKSTRRKLFFDSVGKPRLTVSSKGRRRLPSSKTLQQVLKCDDEVFVDFLARCLRWDPDRRMKPDEAIRHEFISGQKPAPPAARVLARDCSPVRRSNTTATPRPLPDPPSAAVTNGVARTGVSPHKPLSGAPRRTSGATAATAASINRRTSASSGVTSISTSGLPRAAARMMNGKQDLAAAGATAAMSRRA